MFQYILKFLKTYKSRIIFYILINIVISVITIIVTIINGEIINALLDKSLKSLIRLNLFLALITIFSVGLNYILSILNAKLKNLLTNDVITSILIHIEKLSYLFISQKDASYLSQRINNDAGTVIAFVLNLVSNIIVNVITAVIILSIFFIIDFKMAIILIVLVSIYILIYITSKKNLFDKGMAFQELLSQFFSKINELISNIQFIKTHVQSRYFRNKLNTIFKKMHDNSLIYTKASFLYSSSETIITTGAKVIIFIMAGIQVLNGSLTLGYFSILTNYFHLLLNAIKFFFNIGRSYQETLVSYNRIKEIMELPEQKEGTIIVGSLSRISIKNLTFKYDSVCVFKNFNLELSNGNIYGLRGSNGSGKSTLIKLIIGLFVSEYTGLIEYNNIDIELLNMELLRDSEIGFVEQEPVLIHDTIYNNLTLCSQKKDNLDYYISLFNLKEFETRCPDGLNTIIGGQSSNLSGGEKQKITIIRELLKNPKLIIFDEPTSAMDVSSSKIFYSHLQKIKTNKIIILIIHDRDIEKFCDIVVDL